MNSWSTFKNSIFYNNVSTGKSLTLKFIPPETTGRLQPLDVYFFRKSKVYFHFIYGYVTMDYHFKQKLSDNLIHILPSSIN